MDHPGPIFDSFDVDLVIKVLANTLFSPFFIFWVPMFFRAQNSTWDSPEVVVPSVYFVLLSIFWTLRYISKVWRNGIASITSPRLDWGEQTVLIAGGASGIGLILARTLSVRNVTVVVLDIKDLEDTANYDITYFKCDVSKWDEVQETSKKIIEEVGHPTILINCAGVVQGKLITELLPEDVKQTFDTNVLSHFWLLRTFLPHMIQQGTGHIVTLSSVLGLVGVAQMTDYSASKAALINLHESLRYELDKRHKTPHIRTTLALPGHTLTPMFSRMSLPTAWWYRFFVPSLPPYSVVKRIIAAMDNQESGTIFMPFYTHFVPMVRLLPSFFRDIFQWVSFADYSMQGFVKVTARRPEEGEVPSLNESRRPKIE